MIKIKDLEFRQTKTLHKTPEIYWEIVKWDKMKVDGEEQECCYTLASWDKSGEGWELSFVGSRPFEHSNNDGIGIFWELATFGQKYLDALFDLTESHPNLEYGNYYEDKMKNEK
jgi:hypothetical protein